MTLIKPGGGDTAGSIELLQIMLKLSCEQEHGPEELY